MTPPCRSDATLGPACVLWRVAVPSGIRDADGGGHLMAYTTSLGTDDWVARLHGCADPVAVAGETLVAALRILEVDAACSHRHTRGRTHGWRLGARREGVADPGAAGADLRLAPGELRVPAVDAPPLHPDLPGWVAVDLASAWPAGTHLELYRTDPAWPRPADLDRVRTFGSAAGLALRRVEQALNLQRAIESRTVIGQAQGVLMERFGLDAAAALQFLKRSSMDGNRPLREVAADVVDRRRSLWGTAQHKVTTPRPTRGPTRTVGPDAATTAAGLAMLPRARVWVGEDQHGRWLDDGGC